MRLLRLWWKRHRIRHLGHRIDVMDVKIDDYEVRIRDGKIAIEHNYKLQLRLEAECFELERPQSIIRRGYR